LVLKLGAKHAVGTDIDEHALEATVENIEVNHITPDQFELYAGNIIEEQEIQQKVGFPKNTKSLWQTFWQILSFLFPVKSHNI